jgi:hypothetical protein
LETHKDCRGEEKVDCVERDNQCDEMSSLQGRCLADNPLCNCDDDNQSAEQVKECLEKARTWHNNFNIGIGDPFIHSMEEGVTRANLPKEETDCEDGKTECTTQKDTCDEKQDKAQGNFCEFDQQCDAQCSNYQDAFASAMVTYREIYALQVADTTDQVGEESFEQRNKEVCFAAKKVVCYINVIASGHKSPTDEDDFTGTTYDLEDFSGVFTFDACQTYQPGCEHLDVTEPTEPEEQKCSLFDCSAKIAAGNIPENENWLQDYYQDNKLDCSYKIDFYLPSSSKWALQSQQPEAMRTCPSDS